MAYQFQELPKQTPSTGRKNSPQYADAARLAKQHPGRTLHVETDVPRSLYMSIRGYISDPFVTDEGRIQVNMRNSKVHEDGVRRGDLFFTWIPNAKEEN